MSRKQVIAAFGATGAQGGGLARSIPADHDGPFARGLGRAVRHVDVPPEVCRGFGFPGAGDAAGP